MGDQLSICGYKDSKITMSKEELKQDLKKDE